MRLQVISTGSNANCYLLEAGTEVLILDAGLPVRKMLPHIRDFRSVIGCLVTHEHGDHARGVLELVRRGIPVYCSAGTKQALDDNIYLTQLKLVRPLQPIRVGRFTVMGFETQHDAAEPLGFLVRYEATGETLLYATDTYYLRYTFPGVHYWLVECNYVDPRDREYFDLYEQRELTYICIGVAKQRQGAVGKACVLFDSKHMRYYPIERNAEA